ncbi:hypothetical protein RFI_01129 [Reticulomyxa filosa]|uniref:Integrase catalytic domain-containing protein n=1 Tax=Reticulomyxa filosa TaxID=46433 RepID=X6PE41_RETFI|nr:hypothetical protein RFI_01129 [Reticulomyxa filosa]|eukprot:ETO35932.1 hypothetical protein RFI_01129 [Reticulomyxa filosa]
MSAAIQERLYWPVLVDDVKRFCKNCFTCQVSKGSSDANAGEIQHFQATRPFQMVALDIVGPLPKTELGHQYNLTIIDRFTRYAAAVSLKTNTSKDITLSFANEWIYCHGVPETILSDNGTQFKGKIANLMSRLMGVKQLLTSSHHPQTNGMLERFRRYVKERLVTIAVDRNLDFTNNGDWTLFLPAIVASYNVTPNKMSKVSPHELVYGEKIVHWNH